MNNLYYTPPIQEQFDECKAKCIEIWNTYDDIYGYATEKINRIKDIQNVSDNFMFMVALFDGNNQSKLARILSKETGQSIADRIRAGGSPDFLNPFI